MTTCASLPDCPFPEFSLAARDIHGTGSIINVGEGTLYGHTPQALPMGHPVPGFMAYKLSDDHAQLRLLANYSGTFESPTKACRTA